MDPKRTPGQPYARDPKARQKFFIYSAILFFMGLVGSITLAACITMAEAEGPRAEVGSEASESAEDDGARE